MSAIIILIVWMILGISGSIMLAKFILRNSNLYLFDFLMLFFISFMGILPFIFGICLIYSNKPIIKRKIKWKICE